MNLLQLHAERSMCSASTACRLAGRVTDAAKAGRSLDKRDNQNFRRQLRPRRPAALAVARQTFLITLNQLQRFQRINKRRHLARIEISPNEYPDLERAERW
jgi:hypothetical protein